MQRTKEAIAAAAQVLNDELDPYKRGQKPLLTHLIVAERMMVAAELADRGNPSSRE